MGSSTKRTARKPTSVCWRSSPLTSLQWNLELHDTTATRRRFLVAAVALTGAAGALGARPDDGVTNRFGQVHEVDNLFVTDGGVFTSSGAANPTLTIVALAIRQADHITERMARREL